MRREPDSLSPAREHGSHTLKVYTGTVVGLHGSDVFVELGVRMQGVIARDHFADAPQVGDKFEFTLRGQEDGLWVLARREEEVLATWENLELGSWVQARAIRCANGGLEMKIGPLHGFMPKSHTGLARDERPDSLVGKHFTCEVIEIEKERQCVVLSRKFVEQRERESPHQREIGSLRVGERVHGHVTRVEEYGVFVAFGNGLEGLVHVSNIAYARVASPSEVLRVGQSIEASVLAIRAGGKRIALGLKQLTPNPWESVAHLITPGDLVEARVTRVRDFGAFLSIAAGLEGLMPASECDLRTGEPVDSALKVGDVLSVRVLEIDAAHERIAFSLRHAGGARIAPYEAASRALAQRSADGAALGRLGASLKDKLAKALRKSG
ncbi:MAG TPA: S1 RNA-binding domain-containing protein [Planctomycetota bacterium]|nr:S1 RNA-binding domain-containing protein [Planctomycetota bacterium]